MKTVINNKYACRDPYLKLWFIHKECIVKQTFLLIYREQGLSLQRAENFEVIICTQNWIFNNYQSIEINNLDDCSLFVFVSNRYDTAALFQGKRKPVDAESVLKLKTSVCIGYANLFSALCRCVVLFSHNKCLVINCIPW